MPTASDAPPVTQILADFVAVTSVARLERRGRAEARPDAHSTTSAARSARRAIPRVEAALAAVLELAPSPQATLYGRSERVDIGSAALLNGIALAHVRLRRHASEDDHPSRRHPSRRRRSRSPSTRARRGRRLVDAARPRDRRRVPRRQRDLSRPLRPRLAHHRLDRDARRGGRLRAAPAARRRRDGDGARHRGVAAGRRPRAVRHDDQAAASGRRGARRTLSRRCSRSTATRRRRARSRRRAGSCGRISTKCDWREISDGLGERFEIAFNTYKPFACGVVIHPAIDGCVRARATRTGCAGGHRARRPARASAGARADRQDGAAHGARGQVQRLPRVRGRARSSGGRAKASSPTRWSPAADIVALREPHPRGGRRRDRRGCRRRDDHAARTAARCTRSSRTRSAASSGRSATPSSRASSTGSSIRCWAPRAQSA